MAIAIHIFMKSIDMNSLLNNIKTPVISDNQFTDLGTIVLTSAQAMLEWLDLIIQYGYDEDNKRLLVFAYALYDGIMFKNITINSKNQILCFLTAPVNGEIIRLQQDFKKSVVNTSIFDYTPAWICIPILKSNIDDCWGELTVDPPLVKFYDVFAGVGSHGSLLLQLSENANYGIIEPIASFSEDQQNEYPISTYTPQPTKWFKEILPILKV